MVDVIWKYSLNPGLFHDRFELEVPIGAKVVELGTDFERQFCAWLRVDATETRKTKARIQLFATGMLLPSEADTYAFVKTIFDVEHGLVLHAFYIEEPEIIKK